MIINFFDHFFPSLLKLPNFLVEFITPIVKVTKGKQELAFFTLPEYETWKEANADGKGWVIKYFKGLGTSDSQDAKKYFRAMNKHLLPFDTTQAGDRELIDLAFNKKKADDRKEWLRDFVVSRGLVSTRISIEIVSLTSQPFYFSLSFLSLELSSTTT